VLGTRLKNQHLDIICSPQRCQDLVQDILAKRRAAAPEESHPRPLIIWEPVPDRCKPEELLRCTNALPWVDICSPNHAELAGFMGSTGLDPETGEIDTKAVEQSCEQLLGSMPLQSYTLVVRAGEKGCYVARNGGRRRDVRGSKKSRPRREHMHGGLRHDTDMEALFAGLLQDNDGTIAKEEIAVDPGVEKWIPAFHTDAALVRDPTGGGNTFLGGLAVALARGRGIEEAAVWGSVAASLAIEQIGMPELGVDDTGSETWNGIRVDDRVKDLMARS
jgi:sugar/nucleoside kinase (ribokinase family)